MTIQEIQQNNEHIAKMLGWTQEQIGSWFKVIDNAKYVVYSEHNNYPHKGLPFHRDWNWLMQAVEFIENYSDTVEEYKYQVDIQNNHCLIERSDCLTNNRVYAANKIEAVFKAVSKFAKEIYKCN